MNSSNPRGGLKRHESGVFSENEIDKDQLIAFYYGKLFSQSDLNGTEKGVFFPSKDETFLMLDNSYSKANITDYKPNRKNPNSHDFFREENNDESFQPVESDELTTQKDRIKSNFRNGTYVCDYEFAKLSLSKNSNGVNTLGVERFCVVPFEDSVFQSLKINDNRKEKTNCKSNLVCFWDKSNSLSFAVVLLSTETIKQGDRLVLAKPSLDAKEKVRTVDDAVVMTQYFDPYSLQSKDTYNNNIMEKSTQAGLVMMNNIGNNKAQKILMRRMGLKCHLRKLTNQCKRPNQGSANPPGSSNQGDTSEQVGCKNKDNKFIIQTLKDSARTVWQVPTYEFYSLEDQQRFNPELMTEYELKTLTPIIYTLYRHLNNTNFWDLKNEEIDYMMACSESSMDDNLYVNTFKNKIVTTKYLRHKMALSQDPTPSNNTAFWRRMFVRYFKAGSSQHKVLKLKIMLRMSLHKSKLPKAAPNGIISISKPPLDQVRTLMLQRYK